MALRRSLGLLAASVVLLAGMGSGPAFAGDAGTSVGADGTRVTGTPPVTVQDAGNNNATVLGVPFCSNIYVNRDCWGWVNTSVGTPCPASHFCIYTNVFAYEGGKVFSFYHCRNGSNDWALQAWNGVGLYRNNNSGGAYAHLKDVNRQNRLNIPPGAGDDYNFQPIWYVQAC